MALVVNDTPLDPACNSYASLAGMLEYVSTRVPDTTLLDAWEGLDAEVKSMYLVNASRSLDMSMEWIGERYSRDQKLSWPRTEAYVDGFMLEVTTFPTEVVEATYEMALWAMQNNGATYVEQNSGYNAIRVGPIAIDFNERALGAPKQYVPDIVAAILKDLGTVTNPELPGSTTIKQARLSRA